MAVTERDQSLNRALEKGLSEIPSEDRGSFELHLMRTLPKKVNQSYKTWKCNKTSIKV